RFETVYIGGGTPGVLPLFLWEELFAALSEIIDLSALREFTVELNPESTTKEILSMLKTHGVNRLSFGVQSLCDTELSAIGRLHNAMMAHHAIGLAADCGFTNLSADLIYGLPGQTPESFYHSLREILSLPISHLSCYNLQLEEGTPLYEHQENYCFPDEESQTKMYEILLEHTRAAGFEHYEISNFARPGKRAVHNSGYWTGEEYLGLGAASHSKLGDKRYSFAPDVEAFISKEDLDFDECIPLTADDLRTEQIMLGLRTDRGAPMELLDQTTVQKYLSFGLGKICDGRFILNEHGFMVSNTIIVDLI
ncbi:MAG: radical SAM family heme chaperone HemW, partial [Clostridia bacterium]|nr:radical SAM family heme chaperone HemW [Clostridia bacterium]